MSLTVARIATAFAVFCLVPLFAQDMDKPANRTSIVTCDGNLPRCEWVAGGYNRKCHPVDLQR